MLGVRASSGAGGSGTKSDTESGVKSVIELRAEPDTTGVAVTSAVVSVVAVVSMVSAVASAATGAGTATHAALMPCAGCPSMAFNK